MDELNKWKLRAAVLALVLAYLLGAMTPFVFAWGQDIAMSYSWKAYRRLNPLPVIGQ